MIRLKWSPKSIQDLESIWGYIAQESEKAADYVTRRLSRRAKLLCSFPLSGSPPVEIKRKDLREIVCGNYRIIGCTRN